MCGVPATVMLASLQKGQSEPGGTHTASISLSASTGSVRMLETVVGTLPEVEAKGGQGVFWKASWKLKAPCLHPI
jgi:hypothetical protein